MLPCLAVHDLALRCLHCPAQPYLCAAAPPCACHCRSFLPESCPYHCLPRALALLLLPTLPQRMSLFLSLPPTCVCRCPPASELLTSATSATAAATVTADAFPLPPPLPLFLPAPEPLHLIPAQSTGGRKKQVAERSKKGRNNGKRVDDDVNDLHAQQWSPLGGYLPATTGGRGVGGRGAF